MPQETNKVKGTPPPPRPSQNCQIANLDDRFPPRCNKPLTRKRRSPTQSSPTIIASYRDRHVATTRTPSETVHSATTRTNKTRPPPQPPANSPKGTPRHVRDRGAVNKQGRKQQTRSATYYYHTMVPSVSRTQNTSLRSWRGNPRVLTCKIQRLLETRNITPRIPTQLQPPHAPNTRHARRIHAGKYPSPYKTSFINPTNDNHTNLTIRTDNTTLPPTATKRE